jgi:hypothetical protein
VQDFLVPVEADQAVAPEFHGAVFLLREEAGHFFLLDAPVLSVEVPYPRPEN